MIARGAAVLVSLSGLGDSSLADLLFETLFVGSKGILLTLPDVSRFCREVSERSGRKVHSCFSTLESLSLLVRILLAFFS